MRDTTLTAHSPFCWNQFVPRFVARHTSTPIPTTAPNVAPRLLAAKSIQSPLLLPPVQFACRISIVPLITTGANHARRKSFRREVGGLLVTPSSMLTIFCEKRCGSWRRIYSSHIVAHVPPYIAMCTHLSIIVTSSSGVEGTVAKQSTHIIRM